MNAEDQPLFLLGPQPEYATLKTVLKSLNLRQPAALITCGWETEENEDAELVNALREVGSKSINLGLFTRTEQLFANDPELIQVLQARQDEIRHMREVYKDRLHHLLKAARQILRRKDPLVDFSAEQESAIDMIRQLDRQYDARLGQLVDDYENRLNTPQRHFVVAHRREIADILQGVGALIISGGHVAIILNRLKIFGVLENLPQVPIIAWSGGSMALASQIVFFHDSLPQGPGNPEVLRAGMGLFHDLLPLPAADARLKLQDRIRVQLFARRFQDFQCAVMNEQTILERRGESWHSWNAAGSLKLGLDGRLHNLEGASS